MSSMLRKAKWLFFDVGSTIVDEALAWDSRIRETVAQSSIISAEQFYQTMIYYAKANRDPYNEAIREYNLQKTSWTNEFEYLYDRVIFIFTLIHRHYKIGIIANQNLGIKQRLNYLGLSNYIDLVVSSAEEGVSKPNIRIFEIALKRAECEPLDAVMIGDRLDNDIIPAKKIGMLTIWIKQGFGGMGSPTSPDDTPNYIINRLDDLIPLLGL